MKDAERPPTTAVVGAGTMGRGIAQLLLSHGSRVTVVDPSPEALEQAEEHILREAGGDLDAFRQRLVLDTDLARIPADASLMIEAVPEDPAVKAGVLRAISELSSDAVLATNTSSVPVTRLAQHVRRPGRFLGLHFFNPVPRSALVEIVAGEETQPETIQARRRWCGHWQRTAIVVLGPLPPTDLVGLDVRLAIAETLAGDLGDRFTSPALLRELVAAGHLGRKTGRGFYTWTRT
ncbi:3-hydroxyacyl-CoA dehydrogenase family protein [Actinomadura madurae]|uniref:3-hydroxyacyl-CoA dehydrogenase family protein n=1 Tax=Actinomadura madurae TaxID=1993 RepID=UPI00399A040B